MAGLMHEWVAWYYHEHKRCGIALFSPTQVGDGTKKSTCSTRDQAMQRYYDKHPERFQTRRRTLTPGTL